MVIFVPTANGDYAGVEWSSYVSGQVDSTFIEPMEWENELLLIQEELELLGLELEAMVDDEEMSGRM